MGLLTYTYSAKIQEGVVPDGTDGCDNRLKVDYDHGHQH